MTRIKGVIFDKDGTLFDFKASWVGWTRQVLSDLAGADHVKARDLGHRIGFDLDHDAFASDSVVIAGTTEEIAAELVGALPDTDPCYLVGELNRIAAEATQVEAVPLVPLLAELLHRDVTCGVVTNDSVDPARAHLRASGVLDAFDFVAGFDSGYGAKPSPGGLLAFCEVVGLFPAEVVMVGDSLHDLFAARAAGVGAVAVLTGIATADDLSPHADAVLPNIGGLPAWLDEHTS